MYSTSHSYSHEVLSSMPCLGYTGRGMGTDRHVTCAMGSSLTSCRAYRMGVSTPSLIMDSTMALALSPAAATPWRLVGAVTTGEAMAVCASRQHGTTASGSFAHTNLVLDGIADITRSMLTS